MKIMWVKGWIDTLYSTKYLNIKPTGNLAGGRNVSASLWNRVFKSSQIVIGDSRLNADPFIMID